MLCIICIYILAQISWFGISGIEPGHHFPTCALHATSESCTSSCGRGALDGFCRWRAHVSPPSLTSHYATCTPNLATCPDGVCDELEEIDPMLCPQDCAGMNYRVINFYIVRIKFLFLFCNLKILYSFSLINVLKFNIFLCSCLFNRYQTIKYETMTKTIKFLSIINIF